MGGIKQAAAGAGTLALSPFHAGAALIFDEMERRGVIKPDDREAAWHAARNAADVMSVVVGGPKTAKTAADTTPVAQAVERVAPAETIAAKPSFLLRLSAVR